VGARNRQTRALPSWLCNNAPHDPSSVGARMDVCTCLAGGVTAASVDVRAIDA